MSEQQDAAPSEAVQSPAGPERYGKSRLFILLAGVILPIFTLGFEASTHVSGEAFFPGRVGRFSDGQREIILRWVTQETRKLHASSDCFKANGYRIEALPIKREGEALWSRFIAMRGKVRLEVAERIYAPGGGQWSDVSAWYWAALLGRTQGPWWAVTVASQAVD